MAAMFDNKRWTWGFLLLLVTLAAGVAYGSGAKYLATIAEVERARAVQSEIDAALSLLKDTETSQRGFVLTGDARFLQPYQSSRAGIPEHLARLRQVLRDEPKQLVRLRELEATV